MIPRVLIVKDDEGYVDILSYILKEKGYAVDSCFTGEEAVRRFLPGFHDCLVLDYSLGGSLTGLDVAKAARMRDARVGIVVASCHEKCRLESMFEGLGVWSIVNGVDGVVVSEKVEAAIELAKMPNATRQRLSDAIGHEITEMRRCGQRAFGFGGEIPYAL